LLNSNNYDQNNYENNYNQNNYVEFKLVVRISKFVAALLIIFKVSTTLF